MRRFSTLFTELDETTRSTVKVDALVRYFRDAPEEDAVWALHFLSGRKLKRVIAARELRDVVTRRAGLPAWLVAECYDAVGDLGETLSLLLDEPAAGEPPLLRELVERCTLPMRHSTPEARERVLLETWCRLDRTQRFLWHKMMLGSFRVGVARKTVTRALAQVAGVEPAVMAHRLSGSWEPRAETLGTILRGDAGDVAARPYPFFLASALDGSPGELGPLEEWSAEWKYDGVRAQLIRRGDLVVIWSRGEELLTSTFPEIASAGSELPAGTVLDGEILAWERERPLPFSLLQRRLNRTSVEPALWTDVPVVFMAFDLLEHAGVDRRADPLRRRRETLETLLSERAATTPLRIAPLVECSSWSELGPRRDRARDLGMEGLMLKRRAAAYGVGRTRGDWWKWKVDPHTVDAVLVYAQRGSGRRAGLFTDYTFAAWDGPDLIPVAKAYAGLTDAEFREVNRFIRRHTLGRHGPVHLVEPTLVFELAFERVTRSDRHKAGLALRFPRMRRWRRDKKAEEADSIGVLRALLRDSEESHEP